MHESPHLRRLRSDLAAMDRLRDQSSLFTFRASGNPVADYHVVFHGNSLARVRGRVAVADRHEVVIKLGASYPRTMPEIRWLTPIYHPNISEIGMVCLGGYGTHWVPSLNLDELVGMLWDMARFHNYDVRSPYNRDAALWVANQTTFMFPLDTRPIRDLRAALGRVDSPGSPPRPVPEPPGTAEPAASSWPEQNRDRPGQKAGRYAQFVRTLAADPRGGGPSRGPVQIDPDLIIFDDEPAVPEQASPAPTRLRAADEEIVFID